MTLAGSVDVLGGGLAALVLDRVRPGTRTSDVRRSSRITLTGIVEDAEVFPSDDPGVTGVDGMEAAHWVAGADAADGVEDVEVDIVVCSTTKGQMVVEGTAAGAGTGFGGTH